MTQRSALLLVSALLNLGLALFLAWRYRNQRVHRVLASMVAGLGLYGLFIAGLAGASDEAAASSWIRQGAVLSYVAVLLFYRFAAVFSRTERVGWVRGLFYLGLAMAAFDVVTRWLKVFPAGVVRLGDQGWFPAPTDVVYWKVYSLLILVLLGTSLGLLVRRRIKSRSPLERRQIGYMFLALAAFILLSFTNLWNPLAFLAAFSPLAFTSLVTYGITRHHLLELDLLLREGAAAALVGLVLAVGLALLLLIEFKVGQHSAGGDLLAVVAAALGFTLLQPLMHRVNSRWLGRWLGVPDLDPGARLLEYSLLANEHPRLEDLLAATARNLADEFGLTQVAVLLPDRGGVMVPYAVHPEGAVTAQEGLDPHSTVAHWLIENPQGLEFDALGWTRRYEDPGASEPEDEGMEGEARAFLRGVGAQAAFGLNIKGRLVGVLAVGAPRSARGLRGVELKFFGALASQLAAVVENAALHGRIQHADRLTTLGTLAASMAHELRNPLASISLFIQMLPQRHTDPVFREKFERIVPAEIAKLVGLTDQLLGLAKPATRAPRVVDLGALCQRLSQLMSYEFRKRHVTLVVEASEGVLVQGVEEELSQVLLNLVLNALDVSPDGGKVEVVLVARDSQAVLTVMDQGPGLRPDQLERLFEPFFTTKAHGNGLGLATSRRIVESFAGSLAAANAPGAGAVFTVVLPFAGGGRPALAAGSAAVEKLRQMHLSPTQNQVALNQEVGNAASTVGG